MTAHMPSRSHSSEGLWTWKASPSHPTFGGWQPTTFGSFALFTIHVVWIGVLVQRLFSTFANGWPGAGLLIQRVVAAVVFLDFAISRILFKTQIIPALPELIGAIAGFFLLIGLWTPLSGTVLAAASAYLLLTEPDARMILALLAVLGVTLAMIGPGAWSLDARIFGRKHIDARYWEHESD